MGQGQPAGQVWGANDVFAALASVEAIAWRYDRTTDQIQLRGDLQALGLNMRFGPAPLLDLLQKLSPSSRAVAAEFFTPKADGARILARLHTPAGAVLAARGRWQAGGRCAAGVMVPDGAFSFGGGCSLTGLLDRQGFVRQCREALRETGDRLLILADYHRFRRLNEAMGHDCGDHVLHLVADRLASTFPFRGNAARIGDNLFALLTPIGLQYPVEHLRIALEKPMKVASIEIHPKFSIGAVLCHGGEDAADINEMLRRGEVAIEKAKSRGGVGHAYYLPMLETDGLERLALETDLRLAFQTGQIEPFFQPIVSLKTGEIVGFEALARWRHPRRGIVPPDVFLGVTRDLGLMDALGLRMMELSAAVLSDWRGRHPMTKPLFISVNLSTGEIHRQGLVGDVKRIIARAGLPVGALKLEVTETDIMIDPDAASKILAELRGVGASLALDDFGTGFSSLSYLARLPFDTLKIDRYFVRTMRQETGSAAIIRSVVRLGRDLSLEVVAEGVEDDTTARELIDVGCQFGQGYGYAPAMPVGEAEDYLAAALARGAVDMSHALYA